ncbi:collagen-like protein [Elizabethkingia meningoseptica]|uniref:collagen-like protein n=1 Tax=Elizabethkingia meningoseptica TaxID=238 RepID=UPI0016296856|nr:collagen-like protein [Elizabethkingia meningoseptica]
MKQFKNVEIVKNENEAIKPNSLYILPLDSERCELFIVDKDGTRVKVKNREIDNYSLRLTKEFSLVPSKSNGEITSPIPPTKANVYKDGNIESQWTFNASFYNCVGNINPLSGDINVTSLSDDSGSVDIVAEKEGNSPLYTSYIITKVKAGDNGEDGENSNGAFKSIAFIRSNSIPNAPSGGSWGNPLPITTGWSDGVPSGDKPIYMSTRIFTMNGESPQQLLWSTPRLLSDTKDIDFEFSSLLLNPGDPTLNPENWYNEAREDSIWMAIRKFSNGNWGTWSISKIKGEKGEEGEKGNYPEQRFAKNGSYTTPPDIDVNQNIPDGWTIKPPSLNSLEILWMTIATKKGSDNSLIGAWSTPVRSTGERGDQGVPGPKGDVGPKGDKGDTGPVSDLFVAPRGSWKNTVQYIGDSKRVEAVIYNGAWYVSRTDAGIIPIGTLPTNTQYWNVADRTFDFIATGIFLAEAAYIENLGVRNLRTSDTGTRIEILGDDNSLTFYSGNDLIYSKSLTLRSNISSGINSGYVYPLQNPGYLSLRGYGLTGPSPEIMSDVVVSNSGIYSRSSGVPVRVLRSEPPLNVDYVQIMSSIHGNYNLAETYESKQFYYILGAGVAGTRSINSFDGTDSRANKYFGGYFDSLAIDAFSYRAKKYNVSAAYIGEPGYYISKGVETIGLPTTDNDTKVTRVITIVKLDGANLSIIADKPIVTDSTSNNNITLNIRGKYEFHAIESSWYMFKIGS